MMWRPAAADSARKLARRGGDRRKGQQQAQDHRSDLQDTHLFSSLPYSTRFTQMSFQRWCRLDKDGYLKRRISIWEKECKERRVKIRIITKQLEAKERFARTAYIYCR